MERKLVEEWQKEVPITDHQLPVGIFSNGEVCKANTNTTMPYSFRVTAKQNIGGNKGIPKGLSVQCVESGISSPQIKTILEAYKRQPESKSKEYPSAPDISLSRNFERYT